MTNHSPFFSIIIPALNEEACLPLLLQDLAVQADKDFEVIVVDGNSTDKTVSLARKFQRSFSRLEILASPKRHVSVQRNLGAKQAHGDYLLFMDADNRLPPTFTLGTKYHLLTTPADIFTNWCTADSDRAGDKSIATALNLAIEASKLIEYEGAVGALIGCKRDCFTAIRGFSERMNYAEDAEIVRRAAGKGFTFTIFRDPRFTYSLRRFRREGSLLTLRRYANLFIKQMSGNKIRKNDYPMGGLAKPVQSKRSKFLKNLQTFFDYLLSE